MGWENPGPAKQVVIAGPTGELLVYSVAQAARRLILAISPVNASDTYGNDYLAGLNILSWVPELPGTADQQINFIVENVLKGFIKYNPFTDTFLFTSAGKLELDSASDIKVLPTGNLQLGATAFAGKISDHDGTWSQLAVPTGGAPRQITTAPVWDKQNTDYAGEWTGCTFTAQVESFYDVTLYLINTLAAANNVRCVIRKNGNNIANTPGSNATDATSNYNGIWLQQNDTLTFFVRQDSGVNQDMSGRISVHRRLA